MDIKSPFPKTARGHRYVLVLQDVFFQKFVDFVPLCSQSASEVCQRSGDWISRLGIPVSAHSDYGPRFSSCEFDTFCKRYDRSFIVNHLPSSREWCCGKVQ
jgi:hypothetical protein